jgi:hypothetical protein
MHQKVAKRLHSLEECYMHCGLRLPPVHHRVATVRSARTSHRGRKGLTSRGTYQKQLLRIPHMQVLKSI